MSVKQPKTCELSGCNEPLKRANQRFCSPKHRVKAFRKGPVSVTEALESVTETLKSVSARIGFEVVARRDELGRPTETVTAATPESADHWNTDQWHSTERGTPWN